MQTVYDICLISLLIPSSFCNAPLTNTFHSNALPAPDCDLNPDSPHKYRHALSIIIISPLTKACPLFFLPSYTSCHDCHIMYLFVKKSPPDEALIRITRTTFISIYHCKCSTTSPTFLSTLPVQSTHAPPKLIKISLSTTFTSSTPTTRVSDRYDTLYCCINNFCPLDLTYRIYHGDTHFQ